MKIFIDESGEFGWRSPGISIVAAVILKEGDGKLPTTLRAFRAWEAELPSTARKNGEVKAHLLSDAQLDDFVGVLHRDACNVTLGAFDSRGTSRDQVARFQAQVARNSTPALLRHAASGRTRSQQATREMIGWISRLAEEQVAWMVTLASAMGTALQHCVVFAMDDSFDEFTDLQFVIDRSWVRTRDTSNSGDLRSTPNSLRDCGRSRWRCPLIGSSTSTRFSACSRPTEGMTSAHCGGGHRSRCRTRSQAYASLTSSPTPPTES